MAPNVVEGKNPEVYVLEEMLHRDVKTDKNYKLRISWPEFIFHTFIHTGALYATTLYFQVKLVTHIWSFMIGYLTGISVAMTAHRGFSHRSYKASRPLQIIGIALQTMAGQNSLYTWARDHRVHHKYSDTDADPHNINRGFFFAHWGWLITKKHPLVIEKGRMIDVSDLRKNKYVMFQYKYFVPLFIVLGFLLPVLVPVYAWNESFKNSFFLVFCLRYVISLHLTWCVNSVAHTFGMKPYDTRIHAAQSRFVWWTTFGEGWHNFHHSFPWDYRSSEMGWFSVSTWYIDLFARLGWIWDLKSVSQEIVNGHMARHGEQAGKVDKEEVDRSSETVTDPLVTRLQTHKVL